MNNLDKTILHSKIETVEQGKAFIEELHKKNKLFHFDDSPYDIGCFSSFEAYHVDFRMTELFKLSDWGEYQDCYGYAMYLYNK